MTVNLEEFSKIKQRNQSLLILVRRLCGKYFRLNVKILTEAAMTKYLNWFEMTEQFTSDVSDLTDYHRRRGCRKFLSVS